MNSSGAAYAGVPQNCFNLLSGDQNAPSLHNHYSVKEIGSQCIPKVNDFDVTKLIQNKVLKLSNRNSLFKYSWAEACHTSNFRSLWTTPKRCIWSTADTIWRNMPLFIAISTIRVKCGGTLLLIHACNPYAEDTSTGLHHCNIFMMV